MKTIITRIVPNHAVEKLIRLSAQLTGSFNAEKIGKHRRGKLVFLGCNSERLDNNDIKITAMYEPRRRMRVVIHNTGKHETREVYEFRSFRKLLKMLVK